MEEEREDYRRMEILNNVKKETRETSGKNPAKYHLCRQDFLVEQLESEAEASRKLDRFRIIEKKKAHIQEKVKT